MLQSCRPARQGRKWLPAQLLASVRAQLMVGQVREEATQSSANRVMLVPSRARLDAQGMRVTWSWSAEEAIQRSRVPLGSD